MFCKNCGQMIADTAAFCVNCGAKNKSKPQAADLPVVQNPSAEEKNVFTNDFDDPFSEQDGSATKPEPTPAVRQEPFVSPAPVTQPVSPAPQPVPQPVPQPAPVYPQQPVYQQPVYPQQPVYTTPMYNQPPSYLNPPPYALRPPVPQLSGFAKGGVFLILLLGIAAAVMLFWGKIIGVPEISMGRAVSMLTGSDDELGYTYYSMWDIGEAGSGGSGYNYLGDFTSIEKSIDAISEMNEIIDEVSDEMKPAYRCLQWSLIDAVAIIIMNGIAAVITLICTILLLIRYSSGDYYRAWNHAGNILRVVFVAQIFELILVLLLKGYIRSALEAVDSPVSTSIFRIAPHLLIAMGVVIVGLIICGSCRKTARYAAMRARNPYYG